MCICLGNPEKYIFQILLICGHVINHDMLGLPLLVAQNAQQSFAHNSAGKMSPLPAHSNDCTVLIRNTTTIVTQTFAQVFVYIFEKRV